MRGFALLVVVVVGIHVSEYGLAVDILVESLRRARAIRVLGCVLFVVLGFLFRTFLLALPVAAKLVVDELVGGKVGLARVRVVADDVLHGVFVDLFAQVGGLLFCGGAAGGIGFLNLPEDVGGAPGGLSIERRVGEHFDETAIEQVGGARGIDGA